MSHRRARGEGLVQGCVMGSMHVVGAGVFGCGWGGWVGGGGGDCNGAGEAGVMRGGRGEAVGVDCGTGARAAAAAARGGGKGGQRRAGEWLGPDGARRGARQEGHGSGWLAGWGEVAMGGGGVWAGGATRRPRPGSQRLPSPRPPFPTSPTHPHPSWVLCWLCLARTTRACSSTGHRELPPSPGVTRSINHTTATSLALGRHSELTHAPHPRCSPPCPARSRAPRFPAAAPPRARDRPPPPA